MEFKSLNTRFRAYQLGNEGSSFSYFDGSSFTLIEARVTETSAPSIIAELKACGKTRIDCLHITSWDTDHCRQSELEEIIESLKPTRIEYPGYTPHTDSGKECLKIVQAHINSKKIDSTYVSNLDNATNWTYHNILYNNSKTYENANDNSTIKLFRSGAFTVLSLGDLEKSEIADYLLGTGDIIKEEVDVMILAHHGADNGFTTEKFIQGVSPKVAICTSNYDNQYDHPKPEIRELLYENSVTLYTTKTGDVVIKTIGDDTIAYKAINLKANSTEVSSDKDFNTKRYDHWL
ncbi:ComEC/Rec2 family competence protein [Pseudotenacibaculum haliotis]|uniref:ComEC/Rec2 family competence protein n=1 Tax=Pseudotenacibaculum haliotis TaxID=1862138 RepID=A0ABW5LY39_9FLAO